MGLGTHSRRRGSSDTTSYATALSPHWVSIGLHLRHPNCSWSGWGDTNAAQYKPNGATPQHDGAARRWLLRRCMEVCSQPGAEEALPSSIFSSARARRALSSAIRSLLVRSEFSICCRWLRSAASTSSVCRTDIFNSLCIVRWKQLSVRKN